VRSHLGEKFDATAANDDSEPAIRAVGPAEAFLRSGVTAFLGTYWPVGDYSARTFSSTFYQSITRGESVGAALTQARKQIDNTIDWANYIYYGSPEFRLKLK
jgi:CHAT domain-containing protein